MTPHGRVRGWRATLGAAALAVLAGAALAGCGETDGAESGTVIEGDGWRGALLESDHESMALPDGTTVDATSGVPERADVERFEEALPPTEEFTYTADGPETIELDEGYVRQYTELSGDGHRQLRVAGLCEDFVAEPSEPELPAPDWTHEWITVADGGSCFWRASMDLATGEILSFSFNGVA
ncbi:hypothetical protein [Streptomyces sp. 6N223]|uniref:hypothetical protein n=1 Tax=Streptomyces sp. 6N223 TaxID=3457412 RepID=UPI003FCF6EF5